MLERGIIFDLFNTLVYIEKSRNPYNKYLKEISTIKYPNKNLRELLLTNEFNSIEQFHKEVFPRENINPRVFDELLRVEIDSIKLYSDVEENLLKLSQNYRLFVLSNLATPYKEAYFKLGLDKYIEKPFFSCELGKYKPDREIFDEVLNFSKISKENLLMIGDSYKSDYQGAVKFGIKSILIDRDNRLKEVKVNKMSNLFKLVEILEN